VRWGSVDTGEEGQRDPSETEKGDNHTRSPKTKKKMNRLGKEPMRPIRQGQMAEYQETGALKKICISFIAKGNHTKGDKRI